MPANTLLQIINFFPEAVTVYQGSVRIHFSYRRFFSYRALAASRAIPFLLSAESFSVRVFLLSSSLPNATTAGFFFSLMR